MEEERGVRYKEDYNLFPLFLLPQSNLVYNGTGVSGAVSMLLNTLYPTVQKLYDAYKKTVWAECKASYALLRSLHCHLQIDDL